jgi:hypothetical protein
MLEKFPNLNSLLHEFEVYMLGDLKVFDKNCAEAALSDRHHRTTISGRRFPPTILREDIPYSSIYPQDMGSTPSAGYVENPYPRLTIPLTLTLFAAIELLGSIYTGKSDGGSTTLNITAFFEKIDPSDRPSDQDIKALIRIYRHGIVHQYFAKNDSLLSYNVDSDKYLFYMRDPYCLNVNYLKNLFLSGFQKMKDDSASFALMEANILKLNQAKVI